MPEYKGVQRDEAELTAAIQEQNWIDSFANGILTEKPAIKSEVDGLKRYKFAAYSGINQPGFLGKFFYIARYADENEARKAEYMNDAQDGSPIKGIKQGKYDTKPWTVNWKDIPQYTKDRIFLQRDKFLTNYNNYVDADPKAKLDDRILLYNNHQEKPEEYKARFLKYIGLVFDGLVGEVKKSEEMLAGGKLPKMSKKQFMQVAATAGTETTIIQAQEGGKTYIQGYIMNILRLDSQDNDVKTYYEAAVNNNMGLLSGPSGTSHRVSNLVKEIYKGNYNLTMKIKTAALCLAALGVPYNCHSFYEIVTVVLPQDTRYHSVEEFRKAINELSK